MKSGSSFLAQLKTSGLRSRILVSRGLRRVLNLFFDYRVYYVDTTDLSRPEIFPEADLAPKVDGRCVKQIATKREADSLAAEGFDFGEYGTYLRKSLDKGATAWCVFVGKKLAHFTFWADNQRGKDAVDRNPYRVDFQNGEVMGGKANTAPRFRRLGLREASGYALRKAFREAGFTRTRASIDQNNYATLAYLMKYIDNKVMSRCLYVKVLWLKYVREKELEPETFKKIVADIRSGQEKTPR